MANGRRARHRQARLPWRRAADRAAGRRARRAGRAWSEYGQAFSRGRARLRGTAWARGTRQYRGRRQKELASAVLPGFGSGQMAAATEMMTLDDTKLDNRRYARARVYTVDIGKTCHHVSSPFGVGHCHRPLVRHGDRSVGRWRRGHHRCRFRRGHMRKEKAASIARPPLRVRRAAYRAR